MNPELNECGLIVYLNTLNQFCRAANKGVHFNSPDMSKFDGSAVGYWQRVCEYYGATREEIKHCMEEI